MQKFDNAGNKVGPESQINTFYASNQNDSSVTELIDGGYVVTWTSYSQDGSYDGIVAQRFAANGSRLGAEVKVNDTTYHHQNQPSIDSLEDGGYVISWTGYNKENSSYDIYTKRYTKEGNEYSNLGELSIEKNGNLEINVADLLSNDVDAENDSFELVSVQNATHGSVELVILASGAKQVVFKAAADFVGKASFTYIIEDEHGATDSATVYVNVAANRSTPLILDLDQDGVQTIGIDAGVLFDIDADGVKDSTGWVSNSDGLLVHDLNADGVINDASELLGEHTVKQDGSKAKDGFDALADLDSNNDGVFNAEDDSYSKLQVWKDANSDGVSQAHELFSLLDVGVASINLDNSAVSEISNDNWTGLRSQWSDGDGEQHNIDDVWFSYEAAAVGKLDFTDLLKTEEVLMDSMEPFLNVAQQSEGAQVDIDETDQFSQSSYNTEQANQVISQQLSNIVGSESNDIVQLLIDNNQINME
ncbi:MAG: cadherin-like domain-containing protein [Oceanospirillaceae bacterium]|nr:cadherin-like domain-containing protein [Oceanospirillaceae bacterium]